MPFRLAENGSRWTLCQPGRAAWDDRVDGPPPGPWFVDFCERTRACWAASPTQPHTHTQFNSEKG
eukprot:7384144-Prymnesium_polylepis.1